MPLFFSKRRGRHRDPARRGGVCSMVAPQVMGAGRTGTRGYPVAGREEQVRATGSVAPPAVDTWRWPNPLGEARKVPEPLSRPRPNRLHISAGELSDGLKTFTCKAGGASARTLTSRGGPSNAGGDGVQSAHAGGVGVHPVTVPSRHGQQQNSRFSVSCRVPLPPSTLLMDCNRTAGSLCLVESVHRAATLSLSTLMTDTNRTAGSLCRVESAGSFSAIRTTVFASPGPDNRCCGPVAVSTARSVSEPLSSRHQLPLTGAAAQSPSRQPARRQTHCPHRTGSR